jgi:hypothetical protein
MLDVLADPHSGMPYVLIGFKFVLYTSNLFSIDSSDFLPITSLSKPRIKQFNKKFQPKSIATQISRKKFGNSGSNFEESIVVVVPLSSLSITLFHYLFPLLIVWDSFISESSVTYSKIILLNVSGKYISSEKITSFTCVYLNPNLQL